MGKQYRKLQRKARYLRSMKEYARDYRSDGEIALLSCKKDPGHMNINYKRGMKPQQAKTGDQTGSRQNWQTKKYKAEKTHGKK